MQHMNKQLQVVNEINDRAKQFCTRIALQTNSMNKITFQRASDDASSCQENMFHIKDE